MDDQVVNTPSSTPSTVAGAAAGASSAPSSPSPSPAASPPPSALATPVSTDFSYPGQGTAGAPADTAVPASPAAAPETPSSQESTSPASEVSTEQEPGSAKSAPSSEKGEKQTGAGGSLPNLAEKLSNWKDDVMTEPVAPPSGGGSTAVQNPLAPDLGTSSSSDTGASFENNMMAPPTPAPEAAKPSLPAKPVQPKEKPAPVSAQPEKTPPPAPAADATLDQPGTGISSPPPQDTVVSLEATNSGSSYPYTIDSLMEIVFEKDASDLHITVGYPAMIRVDGWLMPVGQELVTEDVVSDLILPVLPENKRELLEVNREVDLAYTFREDARFRINAFYTKGHISAAFRLIPNRIRSIEELKLPGSYHQLTKLPQGLVLVTGPTGHGKSTTLAAMLQEVNETYPKHIITIEDPIEYVYPKARALIDQREMHEDTHSWEIALRSAMREDPDVVLVGEMRDFETIQAAITLAETGHLVFATLHTNSAAQTIDRVVDVFPEHQQEQVQTQLSMILEAIISQRLIPVKSGGRRAVSEVLLATGAVRNLIREGKSHQMDNVIRTSLDVGMKTLEHSLVDLIREGEITLDEAESIAIHPEEVARLMKM